MTLLGRVNIGTDRVEIEFLDMQSIDPTTRERKFDKKSENVPRLLVRTRLRRVCREMRMLVENTDDQTTTDPVLLRIVVRAHSFEERLMRTDVTP
jgi:hypothetical protein